MRRWCVPCDIVLTSLFCSTARFSDTFATSPGTDPVVEDVSTYIKNAMATLMDICLPVSSTELHTSCYHKIRTSRQYEACCRLSSTMSSGVCKRDSFRLVHVLPALAAQHHPQGRTCLHPHVPAQTLPEHIANALLAGLSRRGQIDFVNLGLFSHTSSAVHISGREIGSEARAWLHAISRFR